MDSVAETSPKACRRVADFVRKWEFSGRHYFVIPTGFNEDKVVTALEFSPDDPKVTAGLEGLVQSTGRHAEGTAVGFSKKKIGCAQLLSAV